jgi:hypothetical protein
MSVTVPDRSTVRLHRLTMVAEDDGVMVGRPDVASYAWFPEEGAQVLRMLGSGLPVPAVAEWYEQATGSPLDFDDFFAALEDLRFLQADGEDEPVEVTVRWQQLGRWTFSWPAWLGYVALVAAGIVTMVDKPTLRPSYHDVFFTSHLVLIPITLTVVQLPFVLLHEGFHALAGRRLGLPSTLGIGRRLIYLVVETRLDALFSVPRRQRYLPCLAGMLADIVSTSTMTLLSAALAGHGFPAWWSALCLAVAFTGVLRLVWQFLFYLQTDLYFVLATMLRCPDLHDAAWFQLRCRLYRARRRELPRPDPGWSARDLTMAQRYAPLIVVGYGFSLGSLAWAGIPTSVHSWSLIIDRLRGPGTPVAGILDALGFAALTVLQFGLLAYVTVRDRRARKASAS